MKKCLITHINDDKQQPAVIRRRFVPITFDMQRQGQHITFEKKLPFKTAKVVGLMRIISELPKQEPITFPVPISGGLS